MLLLEQWFCVVQVDVVASSLNSNDAFVLVTPAGSKLWLGQGSSDAEKNGAEKLATILGVNPSAISEGAEEGVYMFPSLFLHKWIKLANDRHGLILHR